jgi:hypothetical protein
MTSLITLPIRLPLEITVRAARLGVDVLRAVTGLLEHDSADRAHAAEGGASGAPWPASEAARAEAEPIIVEDVVVPEPAEPEIIEAPIDFDAPGAEELAPTHVDSEPSLAYEAGPADDVGAEVHVDAPWEGYDKMRAADIVTRLKRADDATRAVVRLYEQQGKARSSVLAATA